jgi:hypothetical protein
MSTLTKASATLIADLPEPHAHIAWHALSLCSSIDAEERLIHDRSQRTALAALLNEVARQATNAAMRLNLSPDQADALRAIQTKAPRTTPN